MPIFFYQKSLLICSTQNSSLIRNKTASGRFSAANLVFSPFTLFGRSW